MIHTFSLYQYVTEQSVEQFFYLHAVKLNKGDYVRASVKKLNEKLKVHNPGYKINYLIWKSDDCWALGLKVDVTRILNRGNVKESDYVLVEKYLRAFMQQNLGTDNYFDSHVLTRIDYKYDVVISDENERELLFHLFEKWTKRYRYKDKIKWGKDDDGIPFKYDTSQYHENKSVGFIVYSKEEERESKGEQIMDYEKDIVRYELRLKNNHLYSMMRKDKGRGIARKLSYYFRESIRREYLNKHVSPIVWGGDYYKVYEAEKVIDKSNIPKRKKDKLRSFLVSISKGSIDTPKKEMSKPTYRQRLKDLSDLGINPILIPKNRKDFPKHYRNPFKL